MIIIDDDGIMHKVLPIDILDNLKSEIEQDAFKDVNGSKYISVNRVNQIIDKHKKGVNEG